MAKRMFTTEHLVVLPVPPSINNKYTRSRNGFTIVRSEYRNYIDTVSRILAAKSVKPLCGSVGMEILWFRQARRRDIDSGLKVLLDALNGHCYEDDRQIEELYIRRDDSDRGNPRVEVRVYDMLAEYVDSDMQQDKVNA